MKRKSKAFTLVELLIVIAIISILALVSVIGFNIYKKKAYISNDSAILEQVNICLKGQESLDGKPKTMHDALKQLAECGFKGVELKPQTEGYHFLYNFKDNKFCLVDEEYKEVYEKVAENEYDNWIVVENRDDIITADHSFSIYLSDNYDDPHDELEINRGIGFDTGNYSKYRKIKYDLSGNFDGEVEPFDGEVILRTNNYSSNIEILADYATINQYGLANSISVIGVGYDCLNVNGVIGRLVLSRGKANINEEAEVFYFDASSSEAEYDNKYDNVFNLVALNDTNKTLELFTKDNNKVDINLVANTLTSETKCNHNLGHKLVADDEYVYDVCKNCGYVIKAVLKESATETELKAYDLVNGETNKLQTAIGEVTTYTTVNGETKIQGISFFVGQELGIGYITDAQKVPLKDSERSYNSKNGVLSISLEDYEGLLIDYVNGKINEDVEIYPGAVVIRDETTGEPTAVRGYVDYSVNSGQGELQQKVNEEARTEVKKEVENNSKGTSSCVHDYTNVVVQPTCTTDGYETFTCKKCGHQYTLNIKATGHNYNDGINGTDQCTVCHKNHYFAGGTGAENDPWIIKTPAQLEYISNYYDRTNKNRFYKVEAKVLDCSNVNRIKLNGSFDGNGVEINNLKDFLFLCVGHENDPDDIYIKNVEVNINNVKGNAVVRNVFNSGKTTFKEVIVHGYIEGNSNVAPYYNYGTANNDDAIGSDYEVEFINCKSDATIVDTVSNGVGKYIAHAYPGEGHQLTLTIDQNTRNNTNGNIYVNKNPASALEIACASNSVRDKEGKQSYYNKEVTENVHSLTNKAPEKDTDYYVFKDVAENCEYLGVSIYAQLTATDNEGNVLPNQGGITMTLTRHIIPVEGGEQKINVYGSFNSASVINKVGTVGIVNNKLNVYTGVSTNYTSGTVYLLVNQYDNKDQLISCGKLSIVSKSKDANMNDPWVVQ